MVAQDKVKSAVYNRDKQKLYHTWLSQSQDMKLASVAEKHKERQSTRAATSGESIKLNMGDVNVFRFGKKVKVISKKEKRQKKEEDNNFMPCFIENNRLDASVNGNNENCVPVEEDTRNVASGSDVVKSLPQKRPNKIVITLKSKRLKA